MIDDLSMIVLFIEWMILLMKVCVFGKSIIESLS